MFYLIMACFKNYISHILLHYIQFLGWAYVNKAYFIQNDSNNIFMKFAMTYIEYPL